LSETLKGHAIELRGGDPGRNFRPHHHDLQAATESAADPVATVSRLAHGIALVRYKR